MNSQLRHLSVLAFGTRGEMVNYLCTVPRTKSSAALPNQITTPPASTIKPSNQAGELQHLGCLFSSI